MRDDTTAPLALVTPTDGTITVRGVVRSVVYRNDDQSYSVIRLTTVDGQEVNVVGPLGVLTEGEPVRITGRREESKQHGPQIRATGVVPELPTTAYGIERLLGSGFVGKIGPAIAKRIVQRFGSSTLDVIADHPERLREVDGIGKKRAVEIEGAFRARRAEVEGKAFIQGLRLGPALARRIWERYGADTGKVIRDNPYRLAEEVPGIGFATADKAAKELGIGAHDPRRVAGASLYVILESIDEGHTALPPDKVAAATAELNVPTELVPRALDELVARGTLVRDRDMLYAPPLHQAEVQLARDVARLVTRAVDVVPERALQVPAVAGALEPLNAKQREAVLSTMREALVVLTGGPGTGKTTAVRALVALHHAAGHELLLMAPTGRAAKRLSEATQHAAATIHRSLEWVPRLQRFARNEGSPLDADVVLVDEASMLDVQLASALVRALRPDARLVLVGDADQLPPVGPGTVLADLLAIADVRAVRLTEVFRQASASAIVRCAYEVLAGKVPTPSPAAPPRREGDPPVAPAGEFFLVLNDNVELAAKRLVEMVTTRIPQRFGVDPVRDIQVLVPMRTGPLGTVKLNEALQSALNPGEAASTRKGYRVGDKVMQLKNDYDLEVWNGDLGVVLRVDGEAVTVLIDGREVIFKPPATEHLTLAYAATVHKSQGSEYDVVVIGLHNQHYVLLNRALLYTAITRARRLVVLVGSEYALETATDTARVVERHGALRQRLLDELKSKRRRQGS